MFDDVDAIDLNAENFIENRFLFDQNAIFVAFWGAQTGIHT